jgi:hypothetical protein
MGGMDAYSSPSKNGGHLNIWNNAYTQDVVVKIAPNGESTFINKNEYNRDLRINPTNTRTKWQTDFQNGKLINIYPTVNGNTLAYSMDISCPSNVDKLTNTDMLWISVLVKQSQEVYIFFKYMTIQIIRLA